MTTPPPRKVLYVSPNARRGGAEQGLSLFLRYHDRNRWEPHVAFLNDGPMVEEFRGLGVPCAVSEPMRIRRPRSLLRVVEGLRRRIEDDGIDLVHSVMGYGHLVGGMAARRAGVPEVWFQHGPLGKMDYIFARVPTDTLLANSRYTLGHHGRFGGRSTRQRVIHPGVEAIRPEDFAEEAARHRAAVEAAAGGPAKVFGLVGRLSPMKGHPVLLEAAGRLLRRGVGDFHLLIIGGTFLRDDEAYLESIQARVAALGLDGRVTFTGPLFPPFGAMLACDAIVNCSIVPEPATAVLMEGMMLGRPVIGPDSGGSPEIVEDGETGLLFRMNDPDSLAEAMRRLIESPDPAALGARGRRRAAEYFTIERMTRELEEEYERLFEPATGPGADR